MTDSRIPADGAPPAQTPPDPAPPATGAAPPETGQTGTQTETGPAAEVDYKALFEQAQTKLSKAERTAKDHKSKAAKLDAIEAEQQTDAEKAAQRAEVAEKQVAVLRRRAVDAEIRAAASGWADPTDAPRYLDDRDRYVSADGEIDTATITADLAAVLFARPHLARIGEPAGPRRPAPEPSQGARQSGPAGYDSQIADAEKRGDWATAITLKNQRLAEQAAQKR
ncbi:hypothetical protein [Amycolatopsis sp. BJA-103]|uniref:hypothetical protein n=1 Tax=Amycolatopsis sp. BJA-103 TaxID=1911175 RepID=UPI000C7862C2|nr:hypothetical protein [Amycolatopsis sp. BJA-103]AUI59579.1 hypothetical protein BKN51_16020 [Amycolatopsis sp. BJA-103]PNE16973.1 hypothetical protein B1H26_18495 [Amycolatopsis sp. BJA-103]